MGGGHLAAEVGMSKSGGYPGLHNKPLGCSASEVYAWGPVCEEEEQQPRGYVISSSTALAFLTNISEEHKSTSPSAIQVKIQHKTICTDRHNKLT